MSDDEENAMMRQQWESDMWREIDAAEKLERAQPVTITLNDESLIR